MNEYVLVGGPAAGQRLRVSDGVRILRVPQARPVTVVSGRQRPRQSDGDLTFDYIEYEKVAGTYRWTGMIRDALAYIQVSAEAWRDGRVRRYARAEMRRKIHDLAPDAVVDGVIWRVEHDPNQMLFGLMAVVGGNRVRRGLYLRDQRRFTGAFPK